MMNFFTRWFYLGFAAALCVFTGCSHSYSNARALNAVVTGHRGELIATGEWDWKEYHSGMAKAGQPSFFQIQIQDGQSVMRYSCSFSSQEMSWLEANQIEKPAYSVRFAFIRSSGKWVFSGNPGSSGASGTFEFTANAEFANEAARLCGKAPSLDELMCLSLHDARIESLRQFQSAGYTLAIKDWIRLLNYGVTADYAAGMQTALGKIGIDALIECRNFGMTADFASGYTKAGYSFTYKELIQLRNYGVQAAYAAEFKQGGMALTVDQLVRMRNFGVQPSFAIRAKELGYGDKLDDIIQMRNFGITAEFLSGLKDAGFKLSMAEVIKLRNFGVPVSYLAAAKKAGYSFTIDEIIKLRNYGVSESFLADIVVPGRKHLSADTIVDLRSRGVNASTIRSLREE